MKPSWRTYGKRVRSYPDRATMELTGKKARINFRDIQADNFSGGSCVALTYGIKNMK